MTCGIIEKVADGGKLQTDRRLVLLSKPVD
jgi:hypothetical protein